MTLPGTYILRRLLIALPSLLGISVVLFTVLALAPGDPFGEMATNPNIPPEVAANLRLKFGMDDPVPIRYLRWLAAMLQGDWGFSFANRINVDTLIMQRLGTTILIIGSSQLLALLIALPVGVYAATRPYSLFDQIANTLTFIGFSLPTFFTGLLLILVFSIQLDWLPFVYRSDIAATGWRFFWEHFRQAIMPVAVLGLFQAASWTRYVRSAALDVIRLDYVTTARSKGLTERVVIVKHVVRNALIPVVTLVALQLPALFGGAIVTEQIFRVPGIGSLLIRAILANDTPVIMAVTFVFSCLVITFNVVADMRLLCRDMQIIFQDPYASLDPRMTVGAIVGEALVIHKLTRTQGEYRDRIVELLETAGLHADHLRRYPHEFSGGQRQRIGIARALAVSPKLIVCDEPVSALDVSIQAQVINLLEDLQEKFDLTYLFIAHDLSVVEHISDRVAVMYLGRMVEIAPARELYTAPRHPYTEALMSAVPIPEPGFKRTRIRLVGDVPNPINPPSGCHFHPRCSKVMARCKTESPVFRQISDGHWAACHLNDAAG